MLLGLSLTFGVEARGAGGFLPMSAGSCTLWLTAETATWAGSNLATWTDQSGAGHDCTIVAAHEPTKVTVGGRTAVQFTIAGTQYVRCDGLAAAINGTDKPWCAIWCLQVQNATNQQTLLAISDSASANSTVKHYLKSGTPTWDVYRRDAALGTSDVTFQTPATGIQALIAVDDAANSRARHRVGSSASGPTAYTDRGSLTLNQAAIGVWLRAGTLSDYLTAAVFEVAFFSSAPSDALAVEVANGMLARNGQTLIT